MSKQTGTSEAVQKRQLLGVSIAIVAAILFSIKGILVKLAYQYEVDALTLLFLRMLFSLPVYLVIAGYTTKHSTYQLTFRNGCKIALLGMIGYFFASLCDFVGLTYISASLDRLILFIYPTLVVLIGAIFLKKPITSNQYIALALCYIGVFIVFAGNVSMDDQSNLLIGGSLVFAAALLFAIYLVGSEQFLKEMSSWQYTSYAMTSAAIGVISYFFIAKQGQFNWDYPYQVYVLGLVIAIFVTVVPSFLMSECIRILGAGNASIIGSFGPISTIVLAYFILDERLSLLQMFGSAFILGGILLISLQKHKGK